MNLVSSNESSNELMYFVVNMEFGLFALAEYVQDRKSLPHTKGERMEMGESTTVSYLSHLVNILELVYGLSVIM